MLKRFNQFFKFLIVGFNNTAIDFLILNILMNVFQIYHHWPVVIFNIISFSLAVTNSYLINRYWTFVEDGNKKIKRIQLLLILNFLFILFSLGFLKINFLSIALIIIFFAQVFGLNFWIIKFYSAEDKKLFNSVEFGKFVFLTLIGVAINSFILYFVSSRITPWDGLSLAVWANLAKALATIISLFWNFFAYKIFIFKKAI